MNENPPAPSQDATSRLRVWLFRLLSIGLSLAVFLGGMELVLRIIGFQFKPPPLRIEVQGQLLDPMFQEGEAKRWVPIPNTGPFNQTGFVGPEISIARAPGVVRIAALGDSCTQFGAPPYAARLQALIQDETMGDVEVLNAGVAGYSTHQGVERWQRDVAQYHPEVVTIYFGWNDHWRWREWSDREVSQPPTGFDPMQLVQPLEASRVVQAIIMLGDTFGFMQEAKRANAVTRVPILEYGANLKLLIQLVRESGAEPVLISAPTDLAPTLFDPSQSLDSETRQMLLALPEGFEMHDEYVSVTRDVARDTNTFLVDAAAKMDGNPRFMTKDHIHLSEEGIQFLSELILHDLREFVPAVFD